MRFKLDENIPVELAEDLTARGFEADTVISEDLRGASDSIILARAQLEARVLITLDKGIADIRAYPPEQYPGLILLRPQSTGRQAVIAFVRRHLDTILSHDLSGKLAVVTDVSLRIR